MTQEEIKIENKPVYCNAWTSNISDKVMCNTIPCCGYCVHGRTDKVLDGFTAIDKVGKHQAPYYNDMRKEKNDKL
jgi:hypothetical protein